MTQVAIPLGNELDFELCTGDGEPLDTDRHSRQLELIFSVTELAKRERGETDFYVGTDMFVYYDVRQARAIAEDPKTREHFKGPDFFFVDKVPYHERDYWVVWEEGGRYPDVIVELLSASTAGYDKKEKKDFYEKTFHTPEYFHYTPGGDDLAGHRLKTSGYQEIKPTAEGRLWSRKLGLYLGIWEGVYKNRSGKWLRLFDSEGRLVPTEEEAERQRAEAERQRTEAERQCTEAERRRAEAERRRAEAAEQRAEEEHRQREAAEAEIARLRALLDQQ